jgi:threonyl-tRNA synthetase
MRLLEKRPMIIHRSSIGCYERTIAILIEHYQGKFPFWLSPEQVRIIPLNEGVYNYVQHIHAALLKSGIRAAIDSRSETLQKRIRWAQEEYIPLMLIVGNAEKKSHTVSVRLQSGKQIQGMPLEQFMAQACHLDAARQIETEFYLGKS